MTQYKMTKITVRDKLFSKQAAIINLTNYRKPLFIATIQ